MKFVSRARKTFLFAWCFLLLWPTVARAVQANVNKTNVQVVRTLTYENVRTSNLRYVADVLGAALSATTDRFGPYRIEFVKLDLSQDRSLLLLNQSDRLHVLHSVSNELRENEFNAIKTPIFDGLMGKRMLLIHKQRLAEFEGMSIVQLKTNIACQGLHWPDSDILEFNGFKVARVLIFESMFDMLSKSRCDFFPRGLHEIYSEYAQISKTHPNLMIYENLILQYPAPVYFFVGKQNTLLAERLTLGMRIIQTNGVLKHLLNHAKFMQDILPLSRWDNVRTVDLVNPDHLINEQ